MLNALQISVTVDAEVITADEIAAAAAEAKEEDKE